MEPWDVVLTCGGTGGHVLPALALADALESSGLAWSRIGFVGGLRGIETTLVPAAGLDFVGYDVRGLARGRSARAVVNSARALQALAMATVRARRLLRKRNARVVVGMGGYASLPAVLGARRVPVLLYESNTVPGLAVRRTAGRAAWIGTAFASTAEALPRSEHIGFLVRPGLAAGAERREVLAQEAREAFGIDPGRKVLVAMGGSQGARSVNAAMLGLAAAWRDRADMAVVHLTGRSHHDVVAGEVASALADGPLRYVPVAFEDRMERVYAVADVVVARSGAATCAELAATGTPAILVPYPYATDDHQRANADAFAEAGAAVVIDDAELDARRLVDAVAAVLDDAGRATTMREAAARLGAADAAGRLAQVVLERIDPTGVSGATDDGARR